jgi:type 1 glutamine amidotransferase
MKRSFFLKLALAAAVSPGISRAADSSRPRKLVLIAGKPSHPPGMHEFRAGNILLSKRLEKVSGLKVEIHDKGWVKDEATFSDADAVVIFSDGNASHPLLGADHRLKLMEDLIAKGVGFGCIHFGVEVPKNHVADLFRTWIGGCYENAFSCNPIYSARFESFPEHPISRGVKPFSILDEWYFNMRFAEGFDAEGSKEINGTKFTPILITKPADSVRDGKYVHPTGPYPHIQAAKGRKEALLWAVERPDKGRGFGFTGGHFHKNWQDENFRKTILNALCWVSKVDVPADGIASEPVSNEEIALNLDNK